MSASDLAGRTIDLTLRDSVRFGVGRVADLPELVRAAGGDRAFIVTDPGVARSGVAATVESALTAGGVAHGTWSEVEPNPGTSTVVRGSEALRSFGTAGAVVVALGGGSAMDTAKALSLHAMNPAGGPWDLGWDDPALVPGRPVVAIPTTAGTGAETNIYGVITDEASGRKSYIGHRSLLPTGCILDPALTVGLPPAATAATGIDAMTHSLESLLSKNPNPFAEAIALAVIRTVGEWLERAVADGSDLEARSRMLVASHLAGVGQASGTGVGLVHAIGHSVGARGKLPHGTALAAVLPECLAFDIPVRARELALVGVALGVASPQEPAEAAARQAVAGVEALLRRVDQRKTLRELGLGPETHGTIVRDTLDDPAINNTPRMPDEAEVGAILAAVAG
ncbi:MAG: hypothetical protein RL338_1423 [Chloroflexota bacterium]